MSCKFSRNTARTGKLRKLESLSPEDTEMLSSEHGFLRSSRGHSPKCGRCSIADGIGSLDFLLTFLNKKIK